MQGRRFAFGPFVLNPEKGTLLRQAIPISVGYRALLLLEALVRRPGEVLTKSELIDAAWQGSTVEEGNLSVQIASLRKLLGPTPNGEDWIATVPRVGYRFTGDVERVDGGADHRESVETGSSIAVLPFVNLGNEIHQQYFGDGLAEDLITRLARLRWLFVCARNSSFAYGHKAMDVKHIGRELGVRYVLDGSVRRSGKHLRITARASDTQNGRQIWAERYDVEIVDFFVLQDQIAQSVIGAIEPKLYAAEHERFQSRAPGSLDAWGFAIRAMPYIWTWGSSQELDLAEELLTKAINVDPDYPRANCLLAWALAARVMLGLAEPAVQLPIAQDMAQRAIRGDPEDPWTHFAAGFVHMASRRFGQAVAALTEAIVLNPSFAFAHAFLGCAYGYGGMPEDGLHHLSIADRLSPRDFTLAGNLSTRGLCHFVANRFAEAAEYENRAVELRPYFGTAWRTLAASAGMAGDHALANKALSHAVRLQPSLSIQWVEKYHPIVHESDRALYIQGLVIAGLR